MAHLRRCFACCSHWSFPLRTRLLHHPSFLSASHAAPQAPHVLAHLRRGLFFVHFSLPLLARLLHHASPLASTHSAADGGGGDGGGGDGGGGKGGGEGGGEGGGGDGGGAEGG